MLHTATQSYLDSFINHEIHLGRVDRDSFKLDRVEHLLKELGSPEKNLEVVHVAGSKGKGSICAVTASILRAAGYSVGLYTSPHLNNYRERIRVLEPRPIPGVSSTCHPEAKPKDFDCYRLYTSIEPGQTGRDSSPFGFRMTPGERGGSGDIFDDCIGEEELGEVVDEIRPAVERVREGLGLLSFFEVVTALALYYFNKRGVDVVVLETGLGGRLDATNAAPSLVAVIAPISLEHTSILGGTIEKIAGEKAGIIKARGQKVVIAPQAREAREVLAGRCRQFGIGARFVGDALKIEAAAQDLDGQTFDLTTAKRAYEGLRLPLVGRHQRQNAAAAVCAVEEFEDLGWMIPPGAVAQGCAEVFWPGRLEIVGRAPMVLLDGAHNAASARALAEMVREVLGGKRVVVVLGVSADKDADAIRGALEPIAREVILAKAAHPRAGDLEGAVDVKTALELARAAAGPDGVVLVTGSLFVVAEARKLIRDRTHYNGFCL